MTTANNQIATFYNQTDDYVTLEFINWSQDKGPCSQLLLPLSNTSVDLTDSASVFISRVAFNKVTLSKNIGTATLIESKSRRYEISVSQGVVQLKFLQEANPKQ